MNWLLIACITTTIFGGDNCRVDGGVTTALVFEAQCKAMMAAPPKNLLVICVSPEGKVFR